MGYMEIIAIDKIRADTMNDFTALVIFLFFISFIPFMNISVPEITNNSGMR